MTRGNQRERDRERAAARAKQVKERNDGLTPEQRRERDAKALQEKLAKKAEKGDSSSGGSAGASQGGGRSDRNCAECLCERCGAELVSPGDCAGWTAFM